MKRKVISIFTAAVLLLSCPVFAQNSAAVQPAQSNVMGLASMEDIKCCYIVFADGSGAQMSAQDTEKFLQAHLNFPMEPYTQPYNPAQMSYPYFNFYTQTGAGYTFFRSKALCAGFGEGNYVWYRPCVGNAQNMLNQIVEELSAKYRPFAEAIQQQPAFPERNALDLPGEGAVAEVMEAARENILPIALTGRYADAITREEFCVLIGQLLAQTYAPGSASHAIDIGENLKQLLYEKTGNSDPDNPYADCSNASVDVLTAFGVIDGRGDRIFDPQAGISRQEAAKILYQSAALFLEMKAEKANYSDFEQISPWAAEAAAWAGDKHIMPGAETQYFDPQASFTVEQAIVAADRLFHLIAERPTADRPICMTMHGATLHFENRPFIEDEMVYFPLDELLKSSNPANLATYADENITIHIENSIDLYEIAPDKPEIRYISNGALSAVRDTDYAPVLKDNTVYIPYEYVQYLLIDANGYDIGATMLYQNNAMQIQFEIPLRWAGKYSIDESQADENIIVFKHKATASKYNGAGTLFRVCRLTNAELQESLKIFGNQTVVWQSDAYGYVISRPTDVQYPVWSDRDKQDIIIAEEYEAMYPDIDFIAKTFCHK